MQIRNTKMGFCLHCSSVLDLLPVMEEYGTLETLFWSLRCREIKIKVHVWSVNREKSGRCREVVVSGG